GFPISTARLYPLLGVEGIVLLRFLCLLSHSHLEVSTMQFPPAFSLLVMPTYQADKAYVQPGLLIEPAELAKAENLKKFRVLDTRSQKQYEAGHIPGAHRLDTNL